MVSVDVEMEFTEELLVVAVVLELRLLERVEFVLRDEVEVELEDVVLELEAETEVEVLVLPVTSIVTCPELAR